MVFLFGKDVCAQTEPILKDPIVPDSLLADRGMAYRYYKDHFWEACQLDDSTLAGDIRFAKRINAFFDQVVAPVPDSLTMEIDDFVGRIQNKAVRDFVLCFLLDKYEHPTYMTHDEVFVYIAEHYFLNDRNIIGINERSYEQLSSHVEALKRLALFQPAPELSLRGKFGTYINTHSIEKEWLVLFFYDHECELCESEARDMEELLTLFPNMAVYAIDMNMEFQPFDNAFFNVSGTQALGLDPAKAYDVETTPLIYILDKEKRIIAKKLRANQIPIIIETK